MAKRRIVKLKRRTTYEANSTKTINFIKIPEIPAGKNRCVNLAFVETTNNKLTEKKPTKAKKKTNSALIVDGRL